MSVWIQYCVKPKSDAGPISNICGQKEVYTGRRDNVLPLQLAEVDLGMQIASYKGADLLKNVTLKDIVGRRWMWNYVREIFESNPNPDPVLTPDIDPETGESIYIEWSV